MVPKATRCRAVGETETSLQNLEVENLDPPSGQFLIKIWWWQWLPKRERNASPGVGKALEGRVEQGFQDGASLFSPT